MAANGLNAVRTFTVPPPWLLDAAPIGTVYGSWSACRGSNTSPSSMTVLAFGTSKLGSERAFGRAPGHPSVLCYAVGNEIPSGIVRWYGARRIERFLERLCRAAKAEGPSGL